MNYKISSLIILCSLTLISCAPTYNLSETLSYQNDLKQEWENPETTPLKDDEKEGFKGIRFFPIDTEYTVMADFKLTENGKTIPFPTSAKKIKHYKEYGKINFKLKGKAFELTIYQSDPHISGYENSLFLPFMDETNGHTSYGGGRYLDLEISDIKKNKVLIDFNRAYNPYCAYSKYYNCPIPPSNNYLETEINAGVSYSE